MIFVNLTFAELLGFFFTFACLVFMVIVVFGGIMRFFDSFVDEKFWWLGYKSRRRK